MDWSLCVVVPEVYSECLWCPFNAPGGQKSAPVAYTSFSETVTQLAELNCLPVPLAFASNIDINELIQNRAQWHETCHLQFNKCKLARAKKRERDETPKMGAAEERNH